LLAAKVQGIEDIIPFNSVIVSQRLPELLEEVDISEAVEYVLPLLSGLAQDGKSSPLLFSSS
jgi:hypothetical protein